jgi:quinol monooxygenase YgiN
MMIAIVATIQVREEKVSEFESTALELEAKVNAHEPGCQVYRMTRCRSDPFTYRSLEIFHDQQALDHHIAADYFLEAARTMRSCTAGESRIEFADTLA